MTPRVAFFLLLFLTCLPVPGAGAPLSLADAMLLALQHNPGLKAAGLAVEAAEADVARARARFLPQVNFAEVYQFSDSPSQVFMSKLNQRLFTAQDFQLDRLNNPKPYGNFQGALTVHQPVFQAGEALLGYKQAKLGREMAQAGALTARQQVLFQVTQTYFGLHLAEARLGVLKDARKTANEHLKLAQSRYQAGTAIQADVLSAQVHLARLAQEELTAASQVQIARSALTTAIGLPEAAARPLAPAPKEAAPLPARLDDVQQTAQERRPDLQRLKLAAQTAQQEYDKARLSYLPRLRLVAEYDVDQRRLFGPGGDSYTVMALLHLNLFNGLADLAKVRESRAKEAQARELKRELEDKVRHQVTESIMTLKTAHERLKVAQAAVAQAQESLRLIRLRYQEGLTIMVDLLTAEDALKNAQLSRVAALFDTHLAQAGLELALGTLSPPAGEKKTGG